MANLADPAALQRCATASAVRGIALMITAVAARAALRFTFGVTRGLGQFHRYDARRYGDDGIAQDHDGRRDELTEGRARRDVAVTHGGERDDGPVDRARDAREARLGPFDEVDSGAEDHDERQDAAYEHRDLGATSHQGGRQHLRLTDHTTELRRVQEIG